MTEIVCYVATFEGSHDLGNIIHSGFIFAKRKDALDYLLNGWEEFKPTYMSRCNRKIIHEYINNSMGPDCDYYRQIVITDEFGYTNIIKLKVLKRIIYLR